MLAIQYRLAFSSYFLHLVRASWSFELEGIDLIIIHDVSEAMLYEYDPLEEYLDIQLFEYLIFAGFGMLHFWLFSLAA